MPFQIGVPSKSISRSTTTGFASLAGCTVIGLRQVQLHRMGLDRDGDDQHHEQHEHDVDQRRRVHVHHHVIVAARRIQQLIDMERFLFLFSNLEYRRVPGW